MQQIGDRRRLALDLALPDEFPARVHHADAGGANRDIKTDKQLHGRPPDRLNQWSLPECSPPVTPSPGGPGAPTTRSFLRAPGVRRRLVRASGLGLVTEREGLS